VPIVSTTLDRIQVLNLNPCGIQSFQTLFWVAQSMPSLQSLRVASSDLSNMEDVLSSSAEAWQRSFTQLKVLDCSDCELSSWTNQFQAYFGKLPALEQLSLDAVTMARDLVTKELAAKEAKLTSIKLGINKQAANIVKQHVTKLEESAHRILKQNEMELSK